MNQAFKIAFIAAIGLLSMSGCELANQNLGEPEYLDEIQIPCEPLSEIVDPCAVRTDFMYDGVGASGRDIKNEPWTYEQLLNNSYGSSGPYDHSRFDLLSATHIVIRGTPRLDTTTCERYPVKFPSWAITSEELEDISRHVEVDNINHFLCRVQVEIHEYILGSGPPELTVAHGEFGFPVSRDPSAEELQMLEPLRDSIVDYMATQFEGIEWVLWLHPSYTTSLELWMIRHSWDVQKQEGGEVLVVAPYAQYFNHFGSSPENNHRILPTLDEFRAAISEANREREHRTDGRIGVFDDIPALVSDAHHISGYFAEATVPGER